jgi:hypothetical protein
MDDIAGEQDIGGGGDPDVPRSGDDEMLNPSPGRIVPQRRDSDSSLDVSHGQVQEPESKERYAHNLLRTHRTNMQQVSAYLRLTTAAPSNMLLT